MTPLTLSSIHEVERITTMYMFKGQAKTRDLSKAHSMGWQRQRVVLEFKSLDVSLSAARQVDVT